MCLHVHLYILMRLAPFLQIHHVVLSTSPLFAGHTHPRTTHTHTPVWTKEPMSGDAMLYPRLPQVPRLCGVRVAACQVICLCYRLVSCVRIALFPGRVSSLSLPVGHEGGLSTGTARHRTCMNCGPLLSLHLGCIHGGLRGFCRWAHVLLPRSRLQKARVSIGCDRKRRIFFTSC